MAGSLGFKLLTMRQLAAMGNSELEAHTEYLTRLHREVTEQLEMAKTEREVRC